jgi:integrase
MKMDVDGKEGWAQWRARRLYALTSLVAMCALRRNEALYAHVADVDFLQRVFWVRPHGDNRGKTAGSEAPVPMPEALVPILECWLEHRLDRPPDFVMPAEVPWLFPTVGRAGQVAPWTSGETGRKPIHRLQAVAARAGVAGMTWQSLRRSWATHAEFHGLGPAMIQRVLRHTTPRTAELWYRTSDLPNLKQAVKGITF